MRDFVDVVNYTNIILNGLDHVDSEIKKQLKIFKYPDLNELLSGYQEEISGSIGIFEPLFKEEDVSPQDEF